jgi:hypothetical protein
MSAVAWTYASSDEYAIFLHKTAGTILELSSGSNGWFRFIAKPEAKSQICWSSTNLTYQDLSDESAALIQQLHDGRESSLNFTFILGNWSGRSSEENILVVSNSEEKGSEIFFTPSGFVYFYRNERALVLDSGTSSNEDAKAAKLRVSSSAGVEEENAVHEQHRAQCMICTKCFYCTGYGQKCLRCGNTDRSKDAGKACGCGGGQSGCRKCGMCNSCCTSIPKCGSAPPSNGTVQFAMM